MVFPAKMGQAPNWEAPLNDLGPLLSCFTPLVCFRKLVKNLRRPQGQGRTLTTFLKKFSTPTPTIPCITGRLDDVFLPDHQQGLVY